MKLETFVVKVSGSRDVAVSAIQEALTAFVNGSIKQERLRTFVRMALGHPDEEVRIASVQVAASSNSPVVMEVVTEAFDYENRSKVRAAMMEANPNLKDGE